MAEIVVAVAIGALAVLPRLAPGNAGQRQQQAAVRQCALQLIGQRSRQFGAHLQRMHVCRVVRQHSGLVHSPGGQQQVGLGRVQVAARRIDPQRPAVAAGLLPGRQRQAVVEQLRHAGQVERRRTAQRAGEDAVVRRRFLLRAVQQLDQPRPVVATERRRLGRPVQPSGAGGELLRAVHAQPVVGTYRVFRRHRQAPATVHESDDRAHAGTADGRRAGADARSRPAHRAAYRGAALAPGMAGWPAR
ncbi:hypothetical protein D9M71_546860 [compost metagenome]